MVFAPPLAGHVSRFPRVVRRSVLPVWQADYQASDYARGQHLAEFVATKLKPHLRLERVVF